MTTIHQIKTLIHLNTFSSEISLATRQRAKSSYHKRGYKTFRGVEARIEKAPTYHQLVTIITINSILTLLLNLQFVILTHVLWLDR